jgi:hypothetical protein
MPKVLRKNAKRLSKRRRHEALTIRGTEDLKKFDEWTTIFAANCVLVNDDWMKVACFFLAYRYMKKAENLRWMEWEKLERRRHKLYIIESFSPDQCYNMFRFKKNYLRKLFTGWGVYTLPEWIHLEQGSLYHREMMFLLLLNRYAHAGTYERMTAVGWGDDTVLSRAFNYASRFLFTKWEALTRNDLTRAADKFGEFNAGVRSRLAPVLVPLNQPLPRDAERMALVLDGTRRDVREPVDDDVEDSTYSAYTASHCLGYLSLIGFDGLARFSAGPFPGRDPDGVFVTNSRVNHHIRQAQIGRLLQYWAYGDRLFNDSSHIRAAPRGGRWNVVPPALAREHKPLRKVRCIIEIFFGKIVNLWKYVDYDVAQKVLLCAVAEHYFNILFITNCHTILQGSVIETMFHVSPGTLQDYLNFQWDDDAHD